MSRVFVVLFTFLLIVTKADAEWTFEISAGSAANLDSNLEVEQSGLPAIRLDADYETRGFEGPLYYAWRIGYWTQKRAWEAEFVHHKIFLVNQLPEIQAFSISHGYNMLMGNHAWRFDPIILRAGGGLILAHPESNVRGLNSEPGYEFTGPVAQVSIGTRLPLGESRLFLNLEGKFTAARAHVSIAQGEATVPNYAFHALAGIGFRL